MIGNEDKERLFAWYEGKLGFDGGPRRSGFRVCHKMLSAELYQEQHVKDSMLAEPQPEAKPVQALSTTSTTCSSPAFSFQSSSSQQQLATLDSP